MTKEAKNFPVPVKFPDGSHRKFGSYEKSGRWFPSQELLDTKGAFNVSTPTRSYPYSYLHNFYTRRLARIIALEKPELYCKIHRIDKRHKHYKQIMAWRVKTKIQEARKESNNG